MPGSPEPLGGRRERLLGIARKALHPGAPVAAALVAASVPLLVYSLGVEGAFPPVRYFSYLFSAYALVVVVAAAPGAARAAKERALASRPYRAAMGWMRGHAATRRWLDDQVFRGLVGLCPSTALSALFVVVNLASGIANGSAWFVALAAYYLALASMRAVLITASARPLSPERERRSCRAVGVLLAVLNLVLGVMLSVMVGDVVTISMDPYLLYVNAGYTLAQVGIAAANVARGRRGRGPLRSAIKAVNLASALVSVIMLQTTMITVHGQGDPAFLRTMTRATGVVVELAVLALSAWLLWTSRRQKDEPSAPRAGA